MLLANRLGIGQLKWELEDYCFRYLHPAEYKRIAKLLHERRIDREHYIEEFVGHLRSEMKAEGVKAEVYGRPKHIYSIWRKMQKKHLAFDELFDVRAVRIVAERLQDCYAALGIVHTHYRHLPDEFDDYVANPKPNGYQSIHTVVLGPSGKTVEIQIRTRQMHEDAELGVAAHWKYKEGAGAGTSGGRGYEDRIAWLRKLIAWQEEMADSGEMLDEVRNGLRRPGVCLYAERRRGGPACGVDAARLCLSYSQRCRPSLHRRQNWRPHRAIHLPAADGRSDRNYYPEAAEPEP